jgi:putative membrane protein
MLTETDHKRIAEAITLAESKTSGEIFCVLAHEVSRYREVPLVWASAAALVLPALAVLAGFDPFSASWGAASVREMFTAYAVLQAALFLAVALIVAQPAVRRLMTPRFLKRHRVRQMARHHFAAGGARLAHAEPHILIYASLADRQVELVAHDAIHRAVGEGPWNAAVAAVTAGMKARRPADGFIRAIEICGEALAAHFPSDGHAKNVLSNDILET